MGEGTGLSDYIAHCERSRAKALGLAQQPTLSAQIRSLERGLTNLTVLLGEANKKIGLQQAQISQLEQDVNDLLEHNGLITINEARK